jgi:hypothetical protein
MSLAVEVVVLYQVVVLFQDCAHFLNLCFEIFVKHTGNLQLVFLFYIV